MWDQCGIDFGIYLGSRWGQCGVFFWGYLSEVHRSFTTAEQKRKSRGMPARITPHTFHYDEPQTDIPSNGYPLGPIGPHRPLGPRPMGPWAHGGHGSTAHLLFCAGGTRPPQRGNVSDRAENFLSALSPSFLRWGTRSPNAENQTLVKH